MNPLLKKRIEHLRGQLDELREVLEQNRAEVKQQHVEKEELLQEKWRGRKHLTTLNRIAEDYDALDDQNQAYGGERADIRERMTRVLDYTKALQKTYKP